MSSEISQPVREPQPRDYSVPWKFVDNWIGVGLLVVIDVIIFVLILVH